MQDNILHFKSSTLKSVFELLTEKPEQEHRLLEILVNKLGFNSKILLDILISILLGDIEKKIASKTTYYLTLLLESHKNMSLVVVNAIDNFLHRPNLSDRAQYKFYIIN